MQTKNGIMTTAQQHVEKVHHNISLHFIFNTRERVEASVSAFFLSQNWLGLLFWCDSRYFPKAYLICIQKLEHNK